jgi:maltose O-acetyltransferase
VYSHDHDIVDQTAVENYHTIVDDDARVTYDSMVTAGARVGKNAIVGAKAIVRGDVPDHHIAVGSPAKSVKIKPGWEDVAEPLEAGGESRKADRRVESDLPENFDEFDEFGRSLTPPSASNRTD